MSRAARNEVVACARALAARGLVVGCSGNVSVRQGNRILITPTRTHPDRLAPGELVAVGLDGDPLDSPSRPPSLELPLHLAVYRRRPDIAALVHTHSPHATAWSFLRQPLSPLTEDNEYYGIGELLTAPPARPGSTELAEIAAAALGESWAVLLSGHGVLAAGTGPREALDVAEAVEHQAQVALLLRAGTQATGTTPSEVGPL